MIRMAASEYEALYVLNQEVKGTFRDRTPQEIIKSLPRGAYTTCMVRDSFYVLDWHIHCQRLVKSLAAMNTALNGAYTTYYAHKERNQDVDELNTLKTILLPSLLCSLEQCVHSSAIVFLVLSPRQKYPGLDVHVICVPHDNTFKNVLGDAVILGGPRSVPIGKDSSWVKDRHHLESLKPEGAVEVLLSSKDGRLLEGLVTNIFVVTEDEGCAVIQTASMEEGVVWGTARKRVIEACIILGVRVIETAPRFEERNRWKEAFISNSLRSVQPIRRIVCDERNVFGHPPFTVEFAQHSLTHLIQSKVFELLTFEDIRVVSS